jgi:hypothetical protein
VTGDNPMGFCVVSVRNGAMSRHWTADGAWAHRYAQLESEQYGAGYIQRHDYRSTGPYWRIVAIYKKGVQLRIAPGQLWLKLKQEEVAA